MDKITIIKTESFYDYRGYLSSMWRKSTFGLDFVEDRLSVSRRHTLRGLHGDKVTGKLFIPIRGYYKFYARSVKDDSDSLFIESLSPDSNIAIYVPPNYINGHYCKTDDCIMMYKWTNEYMGPDVQFTVKYDDPELNINWGITDPIISDRDRNGIPFSQLRANYDQ